MKAKLFLILILSSFYCTAQNLEWRSTFCNQIYDSIETIAYHEGYVYYGGIFKGTVDFDPSANVSNLTANNSFLDIYFCKSDSAGHLIWAKQISIYTNSQFGNNTYLNSINIKVDENGNIYAAGQFVDTLDIDPGAAVNYLLPSSGGNFYMAKFDPNGNLIWAKQTSTINYLIMSDFEMDLDDNLYIAGAFNGLVDFDPDTSVLQLNTALISQEAFICKYNSDGHLLNARNFVSSNNSVINSLAIDVNKNVIISGEFTGTVEFATGVNINNQSPYYSNIFIGKLDSLLQYEWVDYSIYTASNYHGSSIGSISIDNANNIYFTGEVLANSFQFNFDSTLITIPTSFPYSSTFMVKCDANGNIVWAKTFGNQYRLDNKITSLINTDGLLYINGRFEVTSDFDPGADSTILVGNKMYSFLEVLDTAGNFHNVDVIGNGTDNWVNINGFVNDENGNLYLIGNYRILSASQIDCDPGIGTSNLPNTNFVFLVKWGFGNYNNLSNFDTEKGISIFPNPMSSSATVLLSENTNHAKAKIYNAMGQLVNEIDNISGNSFNISRDQLTTGFYFIKLIEDNKIIATEKFILSDF